MNGPSSGDALIIFGRHGETSLNTGARFRGRADPELTENGRRQASLLAATVRDLAPVALYTSPRMRARATAAAVSTQTGLPAVVTAALDDFHYGDWTGKNIPEVESAWPDLYRRWRQDPEKIEFPGGESVTQALWRAETFLRFARDDHPGATIVAITHDAMIRCAICAALEIDLARYHRLTIGLASTTGVRVGAEPGRLEWANETAHLRRAERFGAPMA
jgi:probable phosphoglycerate mutase